MYAHIFESTNLSKVTESLLLSTQSHTSLNTQRITGMKSRETRHDTERVIMQTCILKKKKETEAIKCSCLWPLPAFDCVNTCEIKVRQLCVYSEA